MRQLDLDVSDWNLILEALDRFTRTVAGDLAREKEPQDKTKQKLSRTISLIEEIKEATSGEAD